MIVTAKAGTKVPMEGQPHVYINDNEPQDVPETAYYIRLVMDGSLVTMAETPEEGGGFNSPPTTDHLPLSLKNKGGKK